MKSNYLSSFRNLTNKCIDTELCKIKRKPYEIYRSKFNSVIYNKNRTIVPLELDIEPVSWCNLQCKMCFRNFIYAKKKQIMPLNMIKKISKEAREFGVSSIQVSSNAEASLHPQLFEFLKIVADSGAVDMWFRTNGTKLTKNLSKAIVNLGFTKLSVSIDASTVETYKKIRGGNLNQVINNVLNFLEVSGEKVKLRVTFVKQEENKNEVEEFYNFWNGKADVIDIQQLINLKTNFESIPENIEDDCIEPLFRLSILYDGTILPCCNIYAINGIQGLPYANIKDWKLLDYWNSSELLTFVNNIKKRMFCDTCKKCLSSLKSY